MLSVEKRIEKVKALNASGMPLSKALKRVKLASNTYYKYTRKNAPKAPKAPQMHLIQVDTSTPKLICVVGDSAEIAKLIKGLTE